MTRQLSDLGLTCCCLPLRSALPQGPLSLAWSPDGTRLGIVTRAAIVSRDLVNRRESQPSNRSLQTCESEPSLYLSKNQYQRWVAPIGFLGGNYWLSDGGWWGWYNQTSVGVLGSVGNSSEHPSSDLSAGITAPKPSPPPLGPSTWHAHLHHFPAHPIKCAAWKSVCKIFHIAARKDKLTPFLHISRTNGI